MGQPMPAYTDPVLDPKEFRSALSQFATGVTIVTCNTDDGPVGMTANSFNSVSLDPALVLWSISKTSRRYDYFATAKRFAIHVLDADQANLCMAFSKNAQAFDAAEHWSTSESGVPLIDHCLSRFECETFAMHDGGDHTIIIGKVYGLTTGQGRPLIFSQGGFLS
jgi:flavin reductase (DIM6/NTAB) family NADH-FMN oxidoreductase RutF